MRLAETKAQHFDLVVLDLWVGDGSGVDLCRTIRELDQTTPILFCSGVAYEKNKNEALDAGAQVYLVKPVSIEDMYAAVKDLTSTAVQRGFRVSMGRKASGDLAIAPS